MKNAYKRLACLILFNVFLIPFKGITSPTPVGSKGIRRWARTLETPIISYFLTSEVASIQNDVREGFRLWENIPTSYIKFVEVKEEHLGDIIVKGGSRLNTEEFNTTHNSDGEITRVIWMLNDKVIQSRTISVIPHEIGHAIGLRHSVNDGAVMSYRRAGGYTLTLDDEQAITMLYPNDNEIRTPVGCATVRSIVKGGPGGGSGPTPEFAVLGLIFLLLWFTVKHRHLRTTRENSRWVAVQIFKRVKSSYIMSKN